MMIVEKLDTMLRKLRKCIPLQRATATHPFGIWAAIEATKSSHVLGSVSACLIYARHSVRRKLEHVSCGLPGMS